MTENPKTVNDRGMINRDNGARPNDPLSVLQARVMMYCVLLTGARPETDPVHFD